MQIQCGKRECGKGRKKKKKKEEEGKGEGAAAAAGSMRVRRSCLKHRENLNSLIVKEAYNLLSKTMYPVSQKG